MRYVAAYLLAVLGGKKEPQLDDIQKILAAVGVDCDDSKAKKVIESCKGHDVNDLIEQGSKQLATVPSGGAAPAGQAPAAGGGAEKESAPAEKKEEPTKKVVEEDSEEEDMNFSIFD